MIENYALFNGVLVWKENELGTVNHLIRAVLGIKKKDLEAIDTAEELEREVTRRLTKIGKESINEICFILTSEKGEEKYA